MFHTERSFRATWHLARLFGTRAQEHTNSCHSLSAYLAKHQAKTAWTMLTGFLQGVQSCAPLYRQGPWTWRLVTCPGSQSQNTMKLDFKSRRSGFAADIPNYMLKDTPSGNLNWDFFFVLVHRTTYWQQTVEAMALDEPQFQL